MKNCSDVPSVPANRLESPEVLQRQVEMTAESVGHALDLVVTPVVILNDCRQAVCVNSAFLALAGAQNVGDVLGQRPGDILGCVHAKNAQYGCGSTDFCHYCGGLRSILSSLEGTRESLHCRITRVVGPWEESLDLVTTAVPLDLGGERFSVFNVQDVSHEYRLEALERIFYHDVLNRSAALKLMSQMLENEEIDALQGARVITAAAEEMRDVIQAQCDLSAAEAGSLMPESEPVAADALLESVRDVWSQRGPATKRTIAIGPSCGISVETDASLVARVLGVFVENALEAVGQGGVVTLGCEEARSGVRFFVSNPGVMQLAVQHQVFKRTFSTKSRTRGFGTYAAKLFGERYLGGKVSFSSVPDGGTTFYLWLPEKLS